MSVLLAQGTLCRHALRSHSPRSWAAIAVARQRWNAAPRACAVMGASASTCAALPRAMRARFRMRHFRPMLRCAPPPAYAEAPAAPRVRPAREAQPAAQAPRSAEAIAAAQTSDASLGCVDLSAPPARRLVARVRARSAAMRATSAWAARASSQARCARQPCLALRRSIASPRSVDVFPAP